MKKIKLFSYSLIVTAFFAASAFSQAQPTAKVALVNTDAFYLKTVGIKQIEAGYNQLEVEFKAANAELTAGDTRLKVLEKDITAAQELISKGGKVDENSINAKIEEFKTLQKELKRKSEDAKTKFEKREGEVMNPIVQKIGGTLGEYAKSKGYTLVLDSSKLMRSGILLFSEDGADITKEFITYYNARPGGTATK